MRSLAKVVKQGHRTGEPLPPVFDKFKQAGILFRRGDLHEIFGEPATGKTFLAFELAKTSGLPTLYFSNDSSEMTIICRALAGFLSIPSQEVEKQLGEHRQKASERLAEGLDHIRWSFDPGATLEDIQEELEAFKELYGEYPTQTFIDVLMGVNYAEDTEHASTARVMSFLKLLARSRNTAMVVVHHASEGAEYKRSKNPPICPPMSAAMQKVNQLPALVLSVASAYGKLYVAPVKNRHGEEDPSGRTALVFDFDPALARISE